MGEELLRAFVAIEIAEDVRARCADLISRLRRDAGRVSWVKPSNLHLTLKFLGNARRPQIKRLVESLAHKAMKVSPVDVELSRLGAFPSTRRPRILWIGVSVGAEALRDLARKVESSARKAGFPEEARGFSPHLTLGRVRMSARVPGCGGGQRAAPWGSPGSDLGSLLAEVDPGPVGRFAVNELVVFESRLDPGGSIYTPLHRVRLGRPKASGP